MDRRRFLALPLAATALRAADPKPNVLLIVAGTWRAQAVPWAKDSEISTPNLARFGAESIRFSRAYSSYPRMVPGRTALLRGRFPSTPAADSPSLASMMKMAGFRVGAFGSAEVDEIVSFVHAPKPFYAEWILDTAGGFLDRSTKTPALRMNVPAESQPAAKSGLFDLAMRCAARDRLLGIALAALDRPGLREDTIVVFASDRGEMIGSHGLFQDDAPFEESVRIPLAIRYPRAFPASRDESVLVSQIDLMPTLLGLTGTPIPSHVQGSDLSGWLRDGRGERPDEAYAIGRASQADEWRMLVHGYDKLVTGPKGDVTHLFNLADDPLEQNNLAQASAEQLKRDALLAMQQVWIRKLGDRMDPSGLKTR